VARVRQLLSLVLVALWLPATLHCDLEAVGLDELFRCDVDHHAPAPKDAHAADGCDVLENGWMKRASAPLAAATPIFFCCLVCFAGALPEPPLSDAASERIEAVTPPPELARIWQFLARAAPPPRAPSLAS
jgi:hypothetical protein